MRQPLYFGFFWDGEDRLGDSQSPPLKVIQPLEIAASAL